ncbi:MFS transporter [Amycolatopsis sp. NPDC051045]|uniref:MFS transporter n=1 Tax=Amycolatopsis sp. NPDC051045 TaxID=3156922 RepID=UPI0034249A48
MSVMSLPPVRGRLRMPPSGLSSPVLTTVVVTVGFAATFRVWALLPSLEPELTGLGISGLGLLVAVPLITGALARFPAGVLTDRFGARLVLPVISLAVAVPLLVAGIVGSVTVALIAIVCAGGAAGSMFAAGVAVIARAYPPARRGRALGVFGFGMAGAATVDLLWPHASARLVLVSAAAALAAFALLAALVVRDEPGTGRTRSARQIAAAAVRVPAVPQLAALYAVAFGVLIATATYLPPYLRIEYGLTGNQAVLLTAAFVAGAAVLRPFGGWLADEHAGARMLAACFTVAGVCVVAQAFAPPLTPWTVLLLAGIAVSLGVASGVLLALIGILARPEQVGAVAGVVGTAGAVGGLVPPLLLAGVHAVNGSFGIGMTLLAAGLFAVAAHVRRHHRWIDAVPVPGHDTASGAADGALAHSAVRTLTTATHTLVDEFDVLEFLQRLATGSADLPQVDAAGVMLVGHHGRLQTLACSDGQPGPAQLLEVQNDAGPGRDCLRTGTPVTCPDLAAAEPGWTRFAALALAAGYRSAHVLPIRLRAETVGTLVLFSTRTGNIPQAALRAGQAFADLAAVGLLQESTIRLEYLPLLQQQAILNRKVTVDQATGILAERLAVDMNTAFALLRGHDKPLGDVALDVIGGWLPPAGRRTD